MGVCGQGKGKGEEMSESIAGKGREGDRKVGREGAYICEREGAQEMPVKRREREKREQLE